eukprot:scaffold22373_cov54-Phaeocystis_antarctica.AAC.2
MDLPSHPLGGRAVERLRRAALPALEIESGQLRRDRDVHQRRLERMEHRRDRIAHERRGVRLVRAPLVLRAFHGAVVPVLAPVVGRDGRRGHERRVREQPRERLNGGGIGDSGCTRDEGCWPPVARPLPPGTVGAAQSCQAHPEEAQGPETRALPILVRVFEGRVGEREAPGWHRGIRPAEALELRATGRELLTCEFTLSAVVECSTRAVQSTVRQVMNRHDAGAAGHARVGRQVMARGAAAHPMRGHHVRLGRHSCTHSCWLLLAPFPPDARAPSGIQGLRTGAPERTSLMTLER